MNEKIRENCIVCGNIIFRSTNSKSKKPIRGVLDITCSSKCSKVYDKICFRIRRHFGTKLQKIKREYRKEIEKLKKTRG